MYRRRAAGRGGILIARYPVPAAVQDCHMVEFQLLCPVRGQQKQPQLLVQCFTCPSTEPFVQGPVVANSAPKCTLMLHDRLLRLIVQHVMTFGQRQHALLIVFDQTVKWVTRKRGGLFHSMSKGAAPSPANPDRMATRCGRSRRRMLWPIRCVTTLP